jgi:hypothetical protein
MTPGFAVGSDAAANTPHPHLELRESALDAPSGSPQFAELVWSAALGFEPWCYSVLTNRFVN